MNKREYTVQNNVKKEQFTNLGFEAVLINPENPNLLRYYLLKRGYLLGNITVCLVNKFVFIDIRDDIDRFDPSYNFTEYVNEYIEKLIKNNLIREAIEW